MDKRTEKKVEAVARKAADLEVSQELTNLKNQIQQLHQSLSQASQGQQQGVQQNQQMGNQQGQQMGNQQGQQQFH
ncbi:hypothetical protein [Bacillus albus]|uniref:hypothetical protein n=1 Tax=Bacillus albus TaxID=2026189 RepID=UPI001419AF90|nr:hypothetical protein [Bacillus albus]